ncbi:MAG: universal stress protein [Gammaproteobacteria bacterium]|jgi:hypothetical protein|nr:universal stress protein [Gammaproteobacteria bacterium]
MVKASDRSAIDAVRPTRVVVLVDASPDALHALDMAADLARRHRVPLLAVSVEEPDRVRSAAFSFAREIGAVSGSIRPIDEARWSRHRQSAPASIRRAIERAAEARNVAWELVVLRGRLVDEVLALSEPGDFLMLGRVGWSMRLGRRLGRTTLALAREAVGTVHICSAAPLRDRGRIAVLVEDFDSAEAMLTAAAGLASAMALDLVVFLAPAVGDARSLETWASVIENFGSRWRLRKLSSMGTGEILRTLAEEGAVELVAGRGGAWLSSPAAARLLAHWRMPVLIVPGGPDE